MGQLFQNNHRIKKLDEVKIVFDLIENEKFLIALITHALPSLWYHALPSLCKEILRNYTGSVNNLALQDHHLIKKREIFSLNKVNKATLYEILPDSNKVKPTSQA